MITVLLVDDENATLHSLERNINWQELQLQHVGSISNSQDALQHIKNDPPDILITDIIMPLITGIDLAQYIHSQKINTKVVFLSGYQEFEYARHAINFNVSNYLVKPCEKQNLNNILRQISQECICQKKEYLEQQHFANIIIKIKPQLQEKLLLDLIHGNPITTDTFKEKCDFLSISQNLHYYVIAIEIDDFNGSVQNLQEKDKLHISLYLDEAVKSTLPTSESTWLLPIAEGNYALLVPKNYTSDIIEICNKIRMTFFSYIGLHTTYGIGGPAVILAELNIAFCRAREALLYKYLAGKNTVICYEDVLSITTPILRLDTIFSIQSQIIRAVKNGATEELQSLGDTFFAIIEKHSPSLTKNLLIQFLGALSAELVENGESLSDLFGNENVVFEKLLRFEIIHDAKNWLLQLLQFISDYIKQKRTKYAHHLVQKATQYIDDHYSENLTIATVANEIFLSPGYLMTIFKREMGISINTYLTNKRIERAKELLLEDNLKIYEIAQEIGYANSTFFSSSFRNHVGLSPRQFKEQYLKAHRNDYCQ